MSYEPLDDDGRIVKLRKAKRCEWCGEWLPVRSKAITRTYMSDGVIISSRMHVDCYPAMTEYCSSSDYHCDDGFDGGSMARGKPMTTEDARREAGVEKS